MPYPVALVGEQHYQDAIDRCDFEDPIRVCHEFDNPYDDRALVALSPRGEALGYVPRDSWLREAVFEQGKGLRAGILSLDRVDGVRHVVLSVELTGARPEERRYRPPDR